MTPRKSITHVRVVQEEFDHFIRCGISRDLTIPVSYTHLTLPTIYSV